MIFFTSDQHFDHKNVINYCNRPFYGGLWSWLNYKLRGVVSDRMVEEMNEAIIKRFNSVVGVNDITFHLGDFSLNKHAPHKYLCRLNGTHHLIMGNHDWCHPVQGKSKTKKFEKLYLDAGFASVTTDSLITLCINGNPTMVKLHHMPYWNTDTAQFDDRYKEIRPKDEGHFLLHGHIHEKWKTKGRMLNVGVDVWNYYPVSLEQVIKELELLTNLA